MLLVGLLAVGVVFAGALLALVLPRHCPVTRAAYERIEPGMTQADVEQILGGPPGDYRTRPVHANLTSGGGISWTIWVGDEGEAWVCFEHRVVSVTTFREAKDEPVGLLELIRWRLERLWERWLS
jgi:hypothetical protein